MGKDWKSCESGETGCSELFLATSVGTDWKSCELGEIGHSEGVHSLTILGRLD